ncbi:hypothetical protein ACLKA6_011153 [Drosophila palustris]
MSLSFETALDLVAEQLKIPSKEHKIFLSDTASLANWINGALKESNSIFADSFSNLPATATYMCGNVIDVPANFNCYLLMDLKFPVFTEFHKDGCVYLHCNKEWGESFVSTIFLQNRIRNDLFKMLSLLPIVNCEERSYQLCYHTALYPISAHTIIATQLKTNSNSRIVFEFLLAIKLPISEYPRPLSVPLPESLPAKQMGYWLALPVTHFDANYNALNYLGRSHVWQMANNEQRQRWRLVVRLFYMLSIGNGTLSTIGIHALKHTCINLCERYGLDQADRPLSLKLMDMMNTHGSLKLTEISVAYKSGHIVDFDVHPDLKADCAKTDLLLFKMRSRMNKKTGVDLDKFKLLFGLLKQNTEDKKE